MFGWFLKTDVAFSWIPVKVLAKDLVENGCFQYSEWFFFSGNFWKNFLFSKNKFIIN